MTKASYNAVKDCLRINMLGLSISKVFGMIMAHHRRGGLQSVIRYKDDELKINAEFVPAQYGANGKPIAHKVVGGGTIITPTQFGERLERELKALQIGAILPDFAKE